MALSTGRRVLFLNGRELAGRICRVMPSVNSRKRYAWADLPANLQAAALDQLRWLTEERLREYGEVRPPGWAEWLAPLLTWRLRGGTWVVWCEAWGIVEREGLTRKPAMRFEQLRRAEPSRAP